MQQLRQKQTKMGNNTGEKRFGMHDQLSELLHDCRRHRKWVEKNLYVMKFQEYVMNTAAAGSLAAAPPAKLQRLNMCVTAAKSRITEPWMPQNSWTSQMEPWIEISLIESFVLWGISTWKWLAFGNWICEQVRDVGMVDFLLSDFLFSQVLWLNCWR